MNQLLRFFTDNWKLLGASAIALSGALTLKPEEIYSWSARVHAAQVELLKMDWRGPQVFCTEFSQSYDPKTQSCSGGRKPSARLRVIRPSSPFEPGSADPCFVAGRS